MRNRKEIENKLEESVTINSKIPKEVKARKKYKEIMMDKQGRR